MKNLCDSLRPCRKEEEVKAEFCKFFKMKIFALRGIDHYTERIPAEAYDAPLGMAYSTSNPLVHPDWHDYASRTWSARWHELFGANDNRSLLTWRGRFACIRQRQQSR